jgi:hypothetical protein
VQSSCFSFSPSSGYHSPSLDYVVLHPRMQLLCLSLYRTHNRPRIRILALVFCLGCSRAATTSPGQRLGSSRKKPAWPRSEQEFVRDYIVGRDHAGSPGSDGASPTRAWSLRQLKFLKSPMQGTPADPQFFRRLGAVATAFVQGSHDQADFVVVDIDEILGSHFAERKTA